MKDFVANAIVPIQHTTIPSSMSSPETISLKLESMV